MQISHRQHWFSKAQQFLLVISLCLSTNLIAQELAIDTSKILEKSGRKPRYRLKKTPLSSYSTSTSRSPFSIYSVKGAKTSTEIANGQIIQKDQVGNLSINPTRTFSLENYYQRQNIQVNRTYWTDYAKGIDGNNSIQSRGLFPKIELPPSIDRIFGGSEIYFKPNGSLLLDIGYMGQFVDNPSIPVQLRYVGNLFFNEQAQINFQGKIGDKLNLNTNFDTKASFNFQNQLKLNWKTQEEDILQNIEAGNTSWTLNSQLIPGVQNLFGLKTLMRFGNLDVTVVAAQQRSKQDCITLKGGTQGRSFEIRADQYDENRHFFLSTYFRNNYERALRNMPVIVSGITITRVEVYVTNRTQSTETLRNLVALSDLAEPKPYNPRVQVNAGSTFVDNNANTLFQKLTTDAQIRRSDQASFELESSYGFTRGTDFDMLKGAKRLNEREFKFNTQLGYISLVAPLRNDEVLAVAYEYTLNGRRYKVGELTEDYQIRQDNEVLVLKMLKSSTVRNHLEHPMWDLMMKNIYTLNTSALSKQNFQLRIVYKDDATGIDNSNIIEGIAPIKDTPYVNLLGLDKLNYAGDPQPDGNFDYVEDITIDSKNGRIIFPVLEPFGSSLAEKLKSDPSLLDKYIFTDLYKKTLTDAQQLATKNKFFLKGSFQAGAGGDINLPFGVEPKSVTVSAGGQLLSPGSDFIVEGQSGKVKIINEGVFNSGRELKICYEKPDLFTNQVRSLLGTRLDYNLGQDIHLGATVQRMSETPPAFLRRVAIGNEPVNNTLLGFDMSLLKKSNGLTRILDALPFLSTKETSVIDFQGEAAKLLPNVNDRVQGNAFIDDFESARVVYSMSSQPIMWKPGAVPVDFAAGTNPRELASNFKRAKISAYTVDASLYGQGGFALDVPGLDAAEINAYAYERVVTPKGLFPNKDFANNITNLPIGVLDVAYFPAERGIYNFNTNLSADGLLVNPKTNFGAITRAILADTDFDNANVEQIEFWLMNPFVEGETGKIRDGIFNKNNTKGGKLMFHLGDVSEDFVPDGYSNFENGIPAGEKIIDAVRGNVEKTNYGIAPKRQFVINAFDNQAGRAQQDVGLDGLPNVTTEAGNLSETTYFSNYLNQTRTKVTNSAALAAIQKDPAGDDFVHYLSDVYQTTPSVIQRYKQYMGLENNSPNTDNPTNAIITEANSMMPDREDLNNDNTINEVESYFEYEVDLKKGMQVGQNFIVDKITEGGVDWYLFRIPIKDKSKYKAVNGITGFKSIRFFRMMLKEFEEPVVLRFAQLQLSGYSYRKFIGQLDQRNGQDIPETPGTELRVTSVNIEENGPASKGVNTIPYVVPPGFVRDQDVTTINNARLNEQSMSLCVDNLRPGDARGVFKNTLFDFINYKRLRMFVSMQSQDANVGNVAAFMRIGTDLTDNYYEVENANLIQTQKGQSLDMEIWPMENEFDVEFDLLKQAKIERDRQGKSLDKRFSLIMTSSTGKKYKITVMGRPDQSASMILMIGVRNPSENSQNKSFCVWVNELRASGFDQTSGSAALGKMAVKLADLGQVTFNGAFKNYGFGGVQSKISERSRDNMIEYGITANLNLEKFLPAKWGFRIPFFITYDNRAISPQFDPLDPDIFLSDKPLGDDYRRLVEDRSTRQGFNFTNVRKVRSALAKHAYLWDFSNFSFSYAQAEMVRSSVLIDTYRQLSQRGSVQYTYAANSIFWEPFAKTNWNSQWVSLLKDFNINLIPSSIAVRAEMDRSFVKTQLRNSDFSTLGVTPLFEKYWFFNRQYAVNWNLTKSMVLNYNTRVNAIIDEPLGDIIVPGYDDYVITNIKALGRAKEFDQQAGMIWRLPLQKLPLTDWMNADYTHRVGYNYYANSLNISDDDGLAFGDIIKNTRERGISGKVDFVSLYNRIRALRWANTPSTDSKNVARNPGDEDNIYIAPKNALRSVTRLLLTLRGIQVNYSINESTTLPGFLLPPGKFGMNGNFGAPGFDFISGGQSDAIRFKAAENGWLSKSTFQNIPFTQLRNQRFTYTTQLEPTKDFRVTLDGNYTKGDNYQEFYRPAVLGGPFRSESPLRSGNYSMSFLSFVTAFKNAESVFESFRTNRQVILDRLNRANFGEGGAYNKNSQDVLIPAFFAAYSGVPADKVKFSPFYNLPLPNWKVDYNGLNLLPWITKKFSSFTITHMYSSTYSVGNFVSSLEYGQFENDFRNLTLNSLLYPLSSRFDPVTNNLIPVYVMSTISFTERFSPLIGVNAITKSRVTLRLEYNQDRNVGLNLANSQVAELSNKDLTFSIGFTRANMLIPFKINGRSVRLPNDLRFNMNLTIRDTRTLQRKLDAETIVTQGFINFQFRPQLSYAVSDKLSVTAYFDRMMNNPLVSNAFFRSTAAGGFQIRYSLSE